MRSSLLCLLLVNVTWIRTQDISSCEPEFLEKCIKMGKGFFDNPQNIFPSNSTDIDRVCSDLFPKMWSDFIGCTKSFAASCISSAELSQFNRAVGNSINSVHKMCTNEDYQKDYLKSAECIKNAATEEKGCKTFYDGLLHQINSPSESATLCCAHTAFKDCLMEETKSCSCQGDTCQDGGNLGQATTFARIIVENAIGFLLNRCSKSNRVLGVCQRFVPPHEIRAKEEQMHSLDGSYFPVQLEDKVISSESEPPLAVDPTQSLNTERMPKQDFTEAGPENPEDSHQEEDDNSINFDELLDLTAYRNQFLASKTSAASSLLSFSRIFLYLVVFMCVNNPV